MQRRADQAARPAEAELPGVRPRTCGSRHTVRIGATRRLTADLALPREELCVGQRAVAALDLGANRCRGAGLAKPCECGRGPPDGNVDAVSHGHHKDELAGARSVEDIAQHQVAVRRAGVADLRGEIVDHRTRLRSERLGDDADRPRVHTGDDGVVDLLGGEADLLECRRHRGFGQRDVLALAEALLPLTTRRRAGDAPAVEELGRR